ncbi:MAG TPA: diguanylate cyclase, partial [Pseudohongiella sp.]|nr:diguanylate cyclase [Pseudohongiella sp.]
EQRLDNTLINNLALSGAIMILVLLAAHFTLRSYQSRLEQMATTDQLTGVANRHLFESIFEHMSKSLPRYARPVSLITIDIDHFKQVNDTHGHNAGDMVLQSVATVIKENIRDSDSLCRWGGEEFVLLLDHCTADEALILAGKIGIAVKNHGVAIGRQTILVTLSMGVTQYHIGEPLDRMIARADAALYEAKESGRDRVVLAN